MYGRGYNGGSMRFGPGVTPPIIWQLIVVNVAVWILQHLYTPVNFLWVVPREVWSGAVWQPFTYMFLHAPYGLGHIGFNMLALWMFGSPLVMVWGERRFLRYYLICGVGAGILIATVPYLFRFVGLPSSTVIPTLGASGAVFGVLLGYSLLWPNRTIMLLFPPIPIKAIYFIPFIFFLGLLTQPNVSHVGHLGGVLVGFWLLRSEGLTQNLPIPSLRTLQHRWHRYLMRRRLRAVRREEWEARDRHRHDDRRPR